MSASHLHVSVGELATRRERACAELAARDLAGLLVFKQESRYYLTGYDDGTFDYLHCLYLGGDGAMTLLCRLPDVRQARFTSVIEDVRAWVDGPDARPAERLREILDEHRARGLRIGIEKRAYGLNAPIWQQVRAALAGFCRLEDASDLVDRLRLRKSEQELRYVARAAELADDALHEAHRLVAPGAFEGDILAAMQGAIFRGGGDFPASEWPIGSGPGALMVRYHSGRRRLDRNDQLQLEFASSYRRYHACLMRTVLTGAASARHRAMHAACKDALAACQARCRPGATLGEVFDAQARVFDDAGFREHRLNACGYSLGATYSPNWMDWPMFFTGNPVVIEPSSVFFLHMILLDSRHGLAMSLGETVRVTDTGCVSLSKMPHELVVKP